MGIQTAFRVGLLQTICKGAEFHVIKEKRYSNIYHMSINFKVRPSFGKDMEQRDFSLENSLVLLNLN